MRYQLLMGLFYIVAPVLSICVAILPRPKLANVVMHSIMAMLFLGTQLLSLLLPPVTFPELFYSSMVCGMWVYVLIEALSIGMFIKCHLFVNQWLT